MALCAQECLAMVCWMVGAYDNALRLYVETVAAAESAGGLLFAMLMAGAVLTRVSARPDVGFSTFGDDSTCIQSPMIIFTDPRSLSVDYHSRIYTRHISESEFFQYMRSRMFEVPSYCCARLLAADVLTAVLSSQLQLHMGAVDDAATSGMDFVHSFGKRIKNKVVRLRVSVTKCARLGSSSAASAERLRVVHVDVSRVLVHGGAPQDSRQEPTCGRRLWPGVFAGAKSGVHLPPFLVRHVAVTPLTDHWHSRS